MTLKIKMKIKLRLMKRGAHRWLQQCRLPAEKTRRLKKRKPPFMVFSILFAAVLILGSTLAWYTTADRVNNHLYGRTFDGDFAIVLKDVFPPDDPPEPGETIYKTVGAENVGFKPGFVRLLVLPVMIAANGETVLPATIGLTVTDTIVILDMGSKWVYCPADGYYYYLDVILPGQSAQDLFTELELNSGIGPEYASADLKIEVKCEAAGVNNYRSSWWAIADSIAAPVPWSAIDAALQSKKP